MKKKNIKRIVQNRSSRSKWEKAVNLYALEILEDIESDEITADILEGWNWNGAETAKNYSYGGNSLIYDEDIAERVATPSELKRTRGGELNPNSKEIWIDVQARALRQALILIKSILRKYYAVSNDDDIWLFLEVADAEKKAKEIAESFRGFVCDADFKRAVYEGRKVTVDEIKDGEDPEFADDFEWVKSYGYAYGRGGRRKIVER